jgi:hypothetical protein
MLMPGTQVQARLFATYRTEYENFTQVEEKEDTVGIVTMINGAMSSTLMG